MCLPISTSFRTRRGYARIFLLTISVIWLTGTSCIDLGVDEWFQTRQQGVLIEDLPELGGDYPDALIQGLSRQLIDELNCIEPGVLETFQVAQEPGKLYTENNIPHMLRPEVIEAAEAVAANENDFLEITSGYRDVGMQYYDYLRGQRFGFLAARPGSSRHQNGQAIDVEDSDRWREPLQAGGWDWPLGENDRPHFEWRENDMPDLRRESVRAFQRLWNRNHPDDLLEEDGIFGPITESKIAVTPAEGFAFGGCDLDRDTFASQTIGGEDCDDTRDDIFPGAPEICDDGIDQDCDGEDLPCEVPVPEVPTPETPEPTPQEPSPNEPEPVPDEPSPGEPETPEPSEIKPPIPGPERPEPAPPALGQTRQDEGCTCNTMTPGRPSGALGWILALFLAAVYRARKILS